MIFSEKLFVLRKSKGLTQEELAEHLNVSRQAIAKWESGQAYPDISNIIAISEFFRVTIDHLVKDNNNCTTALVGQIPYEKEEVVKFMIQAKKETYAAKAGECEPTRPNSHDLKYEEGDLLYYDTYLGGECFSGEEAVFQKGIPIFSMNYCGRVLDQNFNSDILKAALLLVPEDKPFRGPAFYQENDYIYSCKLTGDMDWFQGHEEISYKNQPVYECYFHGGAIK